jgi:DNA polymerase III delta prime subunit
LIMTWDNDFRPSNIKDMSLYPELHSLLSRYERTGDFGNLLFYGSTGVGKTTAARILAYKTTQTILEVDCGSSNTRTEMMNLLNQTTSTPMWGDRRIVILDEFQNVSKGAMGVFLTHLERPDNPNTFIFITNEINKVIPQIQSRCKKMRFDIGLVNRKTNEWEPFTYTGMKKEDWIKELHRVGRNVAKSAGYKVTQEHLNRATSRDDMITDYRNFLQRLEEYTKENE